MSKQKTKKTKKTHTSNYSDEYNTVEVFTFNFKNI